MLTIAINRKPYGKLKQHALLIFGESLTTEVEMVPGMGEYRANQIYLTLSSLKTATAVERIFPFIPENL